MRTDLPGRRAVRAIAVAVTAAGLVLAPAAAALADSTTTSFDGGGTAVAIGFGDDWLAAVTVTANQSTTPVASNSGSVDVQLSGIAGVYAASLPIAADGRAYFSQPASRPPLAAGDYEATAIFRPAGGAALDSSQTMKTLPITVTRGSLTALADLRIVPTADGAGEAVLSLGGALATAHPEIVSGTWRVTVVSSKGASISTATATVASASQRVVVPLAGRYRSAGDYRFTAVFQPSERISASVDVSQTKASVFTVVPKPAIGWTDGSLTLSTPVAIVAAAVLVALLVLAVLLLVRLARLRRRFASTSEPVAEFDEPDEPSHEEPLDHEAPVQR